MHDRLTAEPARRVTFTIAVDDEGNEELVPKNPAAIAAHLDEVRARHPERVVPGKTEEERTLEIAKRVFGQRYGDRAIYEPPDADGKIVVRLARISAVYYPGSQQHRGTTRAVRSTRRVRTTASSSGTDPPQAEGDDDPPGPDHDLVRLCEACGALLEGRRRQTKTCDDRCRTAYSRRRRRQLGGGRVSHGTPPSNGNGQRSGNGNGEVSLSPPEFRRLLANAVARAQLERFGGFQAVERQERDLERRRQSVREVAW